MVKNPGWRNSKGGHWACLCFSKRKQLRVFLIGKIQELNLTLFPRKDKKLGATEHRVHREAGHILTHQPTKPLRPKPDWLSGLNVVRYRKESLSYLIGKPECSVAAAFLDPLPGLFTAFDSTVVSLQAPKTWLQFREWW